MAEEKKPKRERADWDAIERDYRADVLSNRELSRQYGISEAAIRKKAQQLGWERDLSDKVREKVRNELVRSEVRTEDANPQAKRLDDKAIVEKAAAIQVHAVREHISAIKNGKGLVDLLMGQLKEVIGGRELLEAFVEQDAKEDDDGGKRYNALMKAISLPENAKALTNLSNALKNFITLERQALNIGDEPPKAADPLSALIEHVAKAGSRLPIKPQNKETT